MAEFSTAEEASRAIDTVVMPFTTGQIGGSHVSGVSLAKGLADAFGVRAIILAPDGAEVHGLARDEGLDTVVSGDEPRPRHAPSKDVVRTQHRVRMLRRFGPRAVVHTNDLGALQSWALATHFLGLPLVHHNRAFDRDRLFNRLVTRLAEHVISVSEACDKHIAYLPAARRSVMIDSFLTPVTTDAAAARAALLADMGAPPEVKLVGFVGNYWRRKRPEFFVDVAARLGAQDAGLRFVVFGREGDVTAQSLRARMDATGFGDRFLLAGFRLPPEANLAALDLLLMPAIREPFGRTPVEALLLGVPYVATADAGHLEIHARWGGGVLVSPEADAETYAAACRSVLAAPRAALTLAARQAASAELTPARHAADVMQLYTSLIARRRAREHRNP